MNRRSQFRVAMLLAAIVVGACGGGSVKSARPNETPQSDSTEGARLETLIPSSASFRVVFAWTEGAPGGQTGAFVWTQAAGVRRWDFSPEGAEHARIGWSSVESDFDETGSPATILDCLWEHADGPNVRVGCDAVFPNHPGADALTRLFTGLRVAGRFSNRSIAGRDATCYAFRDSQDTFGEVCVDANGGEPLALSATGGGRNKAFHVFEAVSVGTPPTAITSPTGIPSGTVLSPVTRNAVNLALPPEFVLPQ